MSGFPDEKTAPSAAQSAGLSAARNASLVPAQVLKHSHDADIAMKAFAEAEGVNLEIDAATNARLRGRIDWNLVPVCTDQICFRRVGSKLVADSA